MHELTNSKMTTTDNVRKYLGDFIRANPESYSGKYQVVARNMARPLQIKVAAFVEFAYKPVNLTKVFQDIGRINEAYAMALRKAGATEAGVGLGAVRASNAVDEPASVNFLVAAYGLFGRTRAISEAVGL